MPILISFPSQEPVFSCFPWEIDSSTEIQASEIQACLPKAPRNSQQRRKGFFRESLEEKTLGSPLSTFSGYNFTKNKQMFHFNRRVTQFSNSMKGSGSGAEDPSPAMSD